MSARIVPPSTPLTAPYWAGAQAGELRIQQCDNCGHRSFPPRANCPKCGSDALAWQPVSGRGSVYTFTVAHRPPHPVFREQCPLVIAVVELEEGPRLMTNILQCDPADVRVGMAVTVAFESIDDSDMVLPVFVPA